MTEAAEAAGEPDVPSPLACPRCGADLENDRTQLRCVDDGTAYPLVDGTPVLIPKEDRDRAARIADQFARWWDADGPLYPRQRARVHAAVLDVAGPGEGRWACDVGSGDSELPTRLARRGWDTFALDLVPTGPADRDDGVRRVAARMEAPPFGAGTLDLVVMSGSLQYADDPAAVLAAWADRLAPDGRLLLALTPLHRADRGRRRDQVEARRRIRAAGDNGDTADLAAAYRHLTRSELQEALASAGLDAEVRAEPFSLDFVLWRRIKGVAVGGDIARFPLVVARKEGEP